MTDFPVGATVRFVIEFERYTGTHQPVLAVGHIADRPVCPCAHRVIVPVRFTDANEVVRVVWVSDDQILTIHPASGGPP